MAAQKPLTPRALAFTDELLVDNNGAAAAERAGCTRKNARKQASRWLKDTRIVALVDEKRKARGDRVQLQADDVLREIKLMLQSNVQHFALDTEGNLSLKAGVSEEAWKAVASVKRKRTVITKKDGETIETLDVEFRLWSKPDAARLAGEHLGLYTKKLEHSGEVKGGGVLAVPLPASLEDWGKMAPAQQAALGRDAVAAAEAAITVASGAR